METPASPISTPSLRESSSYIQKSQHSSLSPGRELPKVSPSKCTSSTPVSRHPTEETIANLSSAKTLQRSIKSEKRKDTARRRLLGTMYAKQNEVTRSFTFVAGERPQTELKFPTVTQSYLKTKSPGVRNETGNTSHIHARERPKSDRSKEKLKGGVNFYDRHGTGRIAGSHKFNLPEIIMEFNLEASMVANGRHDFVLSRADAEAEVDERALGVPYEAFLRKPKYAVHNPCRGKYRPVTPGLLDSLNESKMPSKVKTEQWVRSIQTTRKSYCGSAYKIGNLDNANLATPNWIYEYR